MTPRYRILPLADRDLDEQARYLAGNASLEVALRFYDAADQTFAFLARRPGIGAKRASGHSQYANIRVARIHGFETHLVFYRPSEEGIDVVRVLHGHRDIDGLLGPEL